MILATVLKVGVVICLSVPSPLVKCPIYSDCRLDDPTNCDIFGFQNFPCDATTCFDPQDFDKTFPDFPSHSLKPGQKIPLFPYEDFCDNDNYNDNDNSTNGHPGNDNNNQFNNTTGNNNNNNKTCNTTGDLVLATFCGLLTGAILTGVAVFACHILRAGQKEEDVERAEPEPEQEQEQEKEKEDEGDEALEGHEKRTEVPFQPPAITYQPSAPTPPPTYYSKTPKSTARATPIPTESERLSAWNVDDATLEAIQKLLEEKALEQSQEQERAGEAKSLNGSEELERAGEAEKLKRSEELEKSEVGKSEEEAKSEEEGEQSEEEEEQSEENEAEEEEEKPEGREIAIQTDRRRFREYSPLKKLKKKSKK